MKQLTVILLFYFSTSLWADSHLNSSAEYLLNLENVKKDEEILNIFNEVSVKKIKSAGKGRYVLFFAQDPGLKKLQELLTKSRKIGSIQPNFKYRIMPRTHESQNYENYLQK